MGCKKCGGDSSQYCEHCEKDFEGIKTDLPKYEVEELNNNKVLVYCFDSDVYMAVSGMLATPHGIAHKYSNPFGGEEIIMVISTRKLYRIITTYKEI